MSHSVFFMALRSDTISADLVLTKYLWNDQKQMPIHLSLFAHTNDKVLGTGCELGSKQAVVTDGWNSNLPVAIFTLNFHHEH